MRAPPRYRRARFDVFEVGNHVGSASGASWGIPVRYLGKSAEFSCELKRAGHPSPQGGPQVAPRAAMLTAIRFGDIVRRPALRDRVGDTVPLPVPDLKEY
jgi:hypothetical protein